MPGAINMENGGQNGARTDHDRDSKLNGLNGAGAVKHENVAEKGAAAPAGLKTGGAVNGDGPETNGTQSQQSSEQQAIERQDRMNDLPEEITHITQGFVPLSLFLTRLAQTTHNALQEKVVEMAKMPVPANALNGNSSIPNASVDDSSNENLRKKAALLAFAQNEHTKWVKALVITEWSRKSELVSKLIDLKFHIDQQRMKFETGLDNILNVKRDLTFARMPSPDLKTALQVLSTGKAAWMPDLQYIEPPPLTADEQVKWIDDLNTLLSLRLNLEDFDKIPYQFRNYEIDSGRVTFKVPGEFEVDLTIADEDFEKQFWFIDFRLTFSPAASAVPEALKSFLEGHVNEVLSKDGLLGCYQFLHEFVLTHKLNELKRQALLLSKGSWTGTLKVEHLNRALAIQYWTSRAPPTSPKSWVLVAVNSGRKQSGQAESKSSSYLVAKWYRDNKEVKDIEIPLDVEDLSSEKLLKTVIGHHIDYILSGIHSRLQTAPRFRNRDAAMILRTMQSDPAASSLTMRVGYNNSTSLVMEPTTGLFAVKPHSKFTIQHEHQLNNGRNSTEDGVTCLENVRCGFMEDELNRRGSTMGWTVKKCPISSEALRVVAKTREWTKTVWLQRSGWGPNWFVMILLSLGGDEWSLLEVDPNGPSPVVRLQTKLPLNKGYPNLNDSFWDDLTSFSTGMIAQSVDMRELHRNRIKSRPNETRNWALTQRVRLPLIEIALSGIFPSMVFDSAEKDASRGQLGHGAISDPELMSIVHPATGFNVSTKQPWANDSVSIKFNGVEPSRQDTAEEDKAAERLLVCVSDAIIKVRRPAKFAALKGTVDGGVSYNSLKGEFTLQIRHEVGESILGSLKSRIKAVDRLVKFMESIDKTKGTIRSEAVTLAEVTFSYAGAAPGSENNADEQPPRWQAALDLSKDDISIRIQKNNPHLRVVDLMQSLVNRDGGIEALMVWLPATLPALEAIQKTESVWAGLEAQNKGSFKFSMNTVDWMTLHYSVSDGQANNTRQVTLEGKMKNRRGEPWWHIWHAPNVNDTHDEFASALKPVWESSGPGWTGLVTSAAGEPSRGIVGILTAVDLALRPLAGTADPRNQVVILD